MYLDNMFPLNALNQCSIVYFLIKNVFIVFYHLLFWLITDVITDYDHEILTKRTIMGTYWFFLGFLHTVWI